MIINIEPLPCYTRKVWITLFLSETNYIPSHLLKSSALAITLPNFRQWGHFYQYRNVLCYLPLIAWSPQLTAPILFFQLLHLKRAAVLAVSTASPPTELLPLFSYVDFTWSITECKKKNQHKFRANELSHSKCSWLRWRNRNTVGTSQVPPASDIFSFLSRALFSFSDYIFQIQ